MEFKRYKKTIHVNRKPIEVEVRIEVNEDDPIGPFPTSAEAFEDAEANGYVNDSEE